jgi:hypothetical protein
MDITDQSEVVQKIRNHPVFDIESDEGRLIVVADTGRRFELRAIGDGRHRIALLNEHGQPVATSQVSFGDTTGSPIRLKRVLGDLAAIGLDLDMQTPLPQRLDETAPDTAEEPMPNTITQTVDELLRNREETEEMLTMQINRLARRDRAEKITVSGEDFYTWPGDLFLVLRHLWSDGLPQERGHPEFARLQRDLIPWLRKRGSLRYSNENEQWLVRRDGETDEAGPDEPPVLLPQRLLVTVTIPNTPPHSTPAPVRVGPDPVETAQQKSSTENETDHDVQLFKCSDCPYTALTEQGLTMHLVHAGDPHPQVALPCPDCLMVVTTPAALKRHLQQTHGRTGYMCHTCLAEGAGEVSFADRREFNEHVVAEHPDTVRARKKAESPVAPEEQTPAVADTLEPPRRGLMVAATSEDTPVEAGPEELIEAETPAAAAIRMINDYPRLETLVDKLTAELEAERAARKTAEKQVAKIKRTLGVL